MLELWLAVCLMHGSHPRGRALASLGVPCWLMRNTPSCACWTILLIALYIFWIKVLCQIYVLSIFSHSGLSIFSWGEGGFHFGEVQFISFCFLYLLLRSPYLPQVMKIIFFSFFNLLVLAFMLRSAIRFELLFAWGRLGRGQGPLFSMRIFSCSSTIRQISLSPLNHFAVFL